LGEGEVLQAYLNGRHLAPPAPGEQERIAGRRFLFWCLESDIFFYVISR